MSGRLIPYVDGLPTPREVPGLVFVYRNLHKTSLSGGPVYSLRDVASGLVAVHVPMVWLADVSFVVSAAGRDRVRAEGRKNVHAGVRGVVVAPPVGLVGLLRSARYNPYVTDCFVDRETGEPLVRAAFAFVGPAGVGYVAEVV